MTLARLFETAENRQQTATGEQQRGRLRNGGGTFRKLTAVTTGQAPHLPVLEKHAAGRVLEQLIAGSDIHPESVILRGKTDCSQQNSIMLEGRKQCSTEGVVAVLSCAESANPPPTAYS